MTQPKGLCSKFDHPIWHLGIVPLSPSLLVAPLDHTRHTPSDITLQIGNLPPTHYAKGNTSNKLGKLEMADLRSAMTQFNYRPICNYRPEGPNPQKNKRPLSNKGDQVGQILKNK